MSDKQIPLMATLTAMFFAAQMMNYLVVGGATAHLLGGSILAITPGPYAGLVSMKIAKTGDVLISGSTEYLLQAAKLEWLKVRETGR